MADQGFIANTTAPTSIGTSYAIGKMVTLDGSGVPAQDPKAQRMPSACHWSDLEINVSAISTAATLTVFLSWDVLGNYPATSESAAATLVTGISTATLGGAVFALDVFRTFPSVATLSGTLYLHAKVDAGSVTIAAVRLQWNVD